MLVLRSMHFHSANFLLDAVVFISMRVAVRSKGCLQFECKDRCPAGMKRPYILPSALKSLSDEVARLSSGAALDCGNTKLLLNVLMEHIKLGALVTIADDDEVSRFHACSN